jgi:hypothetical protein
MKNSVKLPNPARLAAVMLVAVHLAPVTTLADDPGMPDQAELVSLSIQTSSREQARAANEAAVEEAAKTIEEDTRLNLDIRLIGRTLMLIAGDV